MWCINMKPKFCHMKSSHICYLLLLSSVPLTTCSVDYLQFFSPVSEICLCFYITQDACPSWAQQMLHNQVSLATKLCLQQSIRLRGKVKWIDYESVLQCGRQPNVSETWVLKENLKSHLLHGDEKNRSKINFFFSFLIMLGGTKTIMQKASWTFMLLSVYTCVPESCKLYIRIHTHTHTLITKIGTAVALLTQLSNQPIMW